MSDGNSRLHFISGMSVKFLVWIYLAIASFDRAKGTFNEMFEICDDQLPSVLICVPDLEFSSIVVAIRYAKTF